LKSLYHYTTAAAFESIIRNNCLWATRIEFLNDYLESALFEEYLEAKIFEDQRNHYHSIGVDGSDNVADILGRSHNIASMRSQTLLNIVRQTLNEHYPRYLISFSNHEEDKNYEFLAINGQLSQWRGYGSVGGVCLILDFDSVKEGGEKLILEQAGVLHLDKVRYVNSSSQIEEVFPPKGWEELPSAVDTYLRNSMGRNTSDIPDELHIAMMPFIKVAPFVKHEGFSEEKEFRLVFSAFSNDAMKAAKMKDMSVSNVNFRSRADRLIPYLELLSGGVRSALRGVIVGPGINMWHNNTSIKALLRKHNLEIPVYPSNIPFE
jgi:Protein of unknown function (DUF2971)